MKWRWIRFESDLKGTCDYGLYEHGLKMFWNVNMNKIWRWEWLENDFGLKWIMVCIHLWLLVKNGLCIAFGNGYVLWFESVWTITCK